MKRLQLVFLLLAIGLSTFSQSNFWVDQPIPEGLSRQINPETFRTLGLDIRLMEDYLSALPSEAEIGIENSDFILALPLPDGSSESFRVLESSVMAPELQARFPEIRAFIGQGIDDPSATLRFDLTPAGFHAMIIRASGTIYIDPYSVESDELYMSYTKESFYRNNVDQFNELPPVMGENFEVTPQETPEKVWEGNTIPEMNNPINRTASGTQLRTYRLALSCTGEYAQFHGGTVAGALAAMNTSMVRVNGVYEREVAIRMVLVPNNDQLIFLNGATDPFSNGDGGAMLNQNQTTCDNIIGFANYDIGHVFSTGGGGIAQLFAPCGSGKARGVTGQATPVGDPFDIDYVCHEIGHQFGGNHTQNNPCNRSTGAAYEPGSATTIMGYAGICAPNPQNNSDDYFHNHSYNEIINFSTNGGGNNCPTISATNNTPPVVEAGTGGFTIPVSTPFELTATASDPDGDLITYNWEQYDLGPATAAGDNNLTNPSGNQPIFRSWPAELSPTRVFPRLQDLVNNTIVLGEHLPTYNRNLRFRCTVRDNRAGGGGVNDDEITFGVSSVGGPFLVLSPNTAVNYAANSTQNVTWDVANTTLSPINCASVDIFLSLDGGFTYPITLATNVQNDGSQLVVIPNNQTSTARIKVKASNNIFFDISNQNFTIGPPVQLNDNDVIVTGVISPFGSYCGNSVIPEISVTNIGVNAVTSLTVSYSIDGGSPTNFPWSGNLLNGQNVIITLPSISPGNGPHTFEVTAVNPNGLADEDPSNNTGNSSFDITVGEEVTLNILTDCWGEEVSWTLQVAGGGAVIGSMAQNTLGDLTSTDFDFCLADGCYDLTIDDGFGDGLAGSLYGSCGVDGDYSVTGAQSGVLVQMAAANYGSQIIENFCVSVSNDILGCTNPAACNFNVAATIDDGSCSFPDCTNPIACNYNGAALCDDGSCILPLWYLPNSVGAGPIVLACAQPADYFLADQACAQTVVDNDPFCVNTNWDQICSSAYNCCLGNFGCNDPAACNFEPNLCEDNSLCTYPGCTDNSACNFDPNAGCPDASCTYGSTWYQDNDSDGFGSGVVQTACTQPVGFVSITGDCDDTNNLVYPNAPGTAEGIDNNCNGNIDPDEVLSCPGDFNNDGERNVSDLLYLLGDFGCSSSCTADINGDGTTNSGDLSGFLSLFGLPCPN